MAPQLGLDYSTSSRSTVVHELQSGENYNDAKVVKKGVNYDKNWLMTMLSLFAKLRAE